MRPPGRGAVGRLSRTELGPQSTQHVGVDDDIEGRLETAAHWPPRPPRPCGRGALRWRRGRRPPATLPGSGRLSAGPTGTARASPAPTPEQAVGGRQMKLAGEGIGLGHGGEAVGAPVAADDPLDLAVSRTGCRGSAPGTGPAPGPHPCWSRSPPVRLAIERPSPFMSQLAVGGQAATHRCSGRRPARSRRTVACSSGRSRHADGRGRVRGRPIRAWRISSRRYCRTWRSQQGCWCLHRPVPFLVGRF